MATIDVVPQAPKMGTVELPGLVEADDAQQAVLELADDVLAAGEAEEIVASLCSCLRSARNLPLNSSSL